MQRRLQIFLVKKRFYAEGLIRIILITTAFQLYSNISAAQTNNISDIVEQAWVSRYNGPVNGDTEPSSIAADNAGYVYVTGYTSTISIYPFNHDYATIKYNALTGDTMWVSLYDGPGDAADQGVVVKADNLGNVYVTGISAGTNASPMDFDYATIKYNSAGNIIWIARYDGPGNSTDYVRAMAVDNSGSVYVTGASEGVNTGFDFATIKYNSSGTEEWAARYNGPADGDDESFSIALDNSGNVYVTGYSSGVGTSLDYTTIKYDTDGNMLWVSRYNGPGNDQDAANDIKIDGSGYVYVTGQSIGAGTGYDYATIKYDPATGDTIWVKRYNNVEFYYDYARAIAIDSNDDIYVTGYSTDLQTGYDYTTIKYSTAGTEEWVARYSSPGNNFDLTSAIAADDSGNVYITGKAHRSGYNFEYTTVKYNASGTEEWVMSYTGPGNGDDEAAALTLDNNGDVYVTGFSTGTDTSMNYATIKYEPAAVPVELVSLNASVTDGNNISITWQTATEVNNKGFDVEKSRQYAIGSRQNENKWEKIGFVKGYGTSTESHSYSFIDKNADAGKYKYRLKQIDFDGTYKYSDIVEVNVTTPIKFVLEQNYPNPFNPVTIIQYAIGSRQFVTLKVYDVLGNEIESLVNEEKPAGNYSVQFDGSKFTSGMSSVGGYASGVYFYQLKAGSFIETKKMVLLK